MYGYFEFKAELYFDGKSYIEKGVTYAETYGVDAAVVAQ